MAVPRTRARIRSPDIGNVCSVDPTVSIKRIKGVRVHDIGQGDAISILSEEGESFMQIDYGGRIGNPFGAEIDTRMPVPKGRLLMLSHWDEDHWCSAAKGMQAKSAHWLVPRQITSPRAVKFSLTVPQIHCVPEDRVGQAQVFTTEEGDQIWWEKIAAAPGPGETKENCNHTGIAFSIVRNSEFTEPGQVILLPGDAPYDAVGHYQEHVRKGLLLRGMVAFHHGTNQHWSSHTLKLLEEWSPTHSPVEVVFSCAEENSYGHPHTQAYAELPYQPTLYTTPDLRDRGVSYYDIVF